MYGENGVTELLQRGVLLPALCAQRLALLQQQQQRLQRPARSFCCAVLQLQQKK
jgi:hypothetical protein